MSTTLDWLQPLVTDKALVGSRVTCNPPPTDTDQDVLCLVSLSQLDRLLPEVSRQGFVLDGSEVCDPKDHLEGRDTFQSFSDGETNLILTEDPAFYRKFLAATSVAKRLNLLDKADRIALFQAVLYGNATEEPEA